jgi:hypothetical protein
MPIANYYEVSVTDYKGLRNENIFNAYFYQHVTVADFSLAEFESISSFFGSTYRLYTIHRKKFLNLSTSVVYYTEI